MYTKYYDRMRTALRLLNAMRDALDVPDSSHETTMKRIKELLGIERSYRRMREGPELIGWDG